MNIMVEAEALPDGAILLKVVSDEFKSHRDFYDRGIRLALRAVDQAVSHVTDIRLVAAVERHKREGGDIEVVLRRTNGTLIMADN